MAQRRMFSKAVVNSDRFISMPISSQGLYFQLGVNADDDGFLENPTAICRMVGADESEIDTLIKKDFIIRFRTGIIVISDWHRSNQIRKDRYKPTEYVREREQLVVIDNKYQILDEAMIEP